MFHDRRQAGAIGFVLRPGGWVKMRAFLDRGLEQTR
jgi:hypothetical protein